MQLEVKLALMTCGGMTASIFPEAEAWLEAEADHRHALQFVASRKSMDRYHSVMDFLFCELFIGYRYRCFRFYDRKGPQLRDIITVEQLLFYSKALLYALELAYVAYQEKRRLSWALFRCEVLGTAA